MIFDFDGTLADSFPSFVRILNTAAVRYRFRQVAPHEVNALRGLSSRALMRHLGIAPWKVPLIARHHRREATQHLAEVRLFPGVDAMLRTLAAAGVRLALVSSNSEANVRQVLGPELIALFTEHAYGVSLFGKASRFRQLLRRSGIPPDAALAVGDDLRDLDAARAAGIAFGAVSWGYTLADALCARAPEAHFATVPDIAAAVLAPPQDAQGATGITAGVVTHAAGPHSMADHRNGNGT